MAWMLLDRIGCICFSFSVKLNMLGESCGVTERTLVLAAVILVSSFTSDTTSLCDLEQVTLPLCALVSSTLIWDNSYLSNLRYNASLCLMFLICIIGIIIMPTSQGCCEDSPEYVYSAWHISSQ